MQVAGGRAGASGSLQGRAAASSMWNAQHVQHNGILCNTRIPKHLMPGASSEVRRAAERF